MAQQGARGAGWTSPGRTVLPANAGWRFGAGRVMQRPESLDAPQRRFLWGIAARSAAQQ
jgi:hypothetical protein